MSTSVKLGAEDKEKLEKLQALVTLKAAMKVTQQELLATLIRDALARGEEFVEKVFKTDLPLSDADYAKVLALIEDWGVETRWEEMDRELYGVSRRGRGRGRDIRVHRR